MLFLAWLHLTSRKKQTLLTLLGILLGTAAYIAISGMMMGFQTFIIDQLINNDAHVRISAREEYLTEHALDRGFYSEDTRVSWIKPPSGRRDEASLSHPKSWMDRLSHHPDVVAFAPQLTAQGLASRGHTSLGVRFIGTDPEKQLQVTTLQKYMTQGSFLELTGGGSRVVLGEGLKNRLGIQLRESVLLSVGGAPPQPFKVVGIFSLGVKSTDEGTVFLSLQDLQKLNRTPSRISDIAIRLTDVRDAAPRASEWSRLSQDKIQSWDQANEGMMSVFKTQDIVRNSMTVSIIIVAAFGIYNILSMAVGNKKREIAILRSMGYLPRDIVNLFLSQGILLGLVGGIIGVALGWITCLLMAQIPVPTSRGLGRGTMLISFDIWIYVKGFFLALLSATLASYWPARAAGKMTPIEIIRNENS